LVEILQYTVGLWSKYILWRCCHILWTSYPIWLVGTVEFCCRFNWLHCIVKIVGIWPM
jgi:hypothetical protein